MLNETQSQALKRWYSQPEFIDKARALYADKAYEDLETFLHMTCLMPLSKHSTMPDYLLDEEGKPLFETNLDPRRDVDAWQDGIEVGWAVMEAELGINQDQIHRLIAEQQDHEWKSFLESVERRKEERKKRTETE